MDGCSQIASISITPAIPGAVNNLTEAVLYAISFYKLPMPIQRLPETTAYVRITHQSWQSGNLEGDVRANDYEWHFQWRFRQGHLKIEPSLGRALIQEPLGRFLERFDYQLEPGGDYSFTIRAQL